MRSLRPTRSACRTPWTRSRTSSRRRAGSTLVRSRLSGQCPVLLVQQASLGSRAGTVPLASRACPGGRGLWGWRASRGLLGLQVLRVLQEHQAHLGHVAPQGQRGTMGRRGRREGAGRLAQRSRSCARVWVGLCTRVCASSVASSRATLTTTPQTARSTHRTPAGRRATMWLSCACSRTGRRGSRSTATATQACVETSRLLLPSSSTRAPWLCGPTRSRLSSRLQTACPSARSTTARAPWACTRAGSEWDRFDSKTYRYLIQQKTERAQGLVRD
mmetsp:Transcript_20077/g.49317  ORF Transcript_20077/g.49317 Transcript_20077/m.49317 type:complete len:274 (+) Transcript_20077:473-1294(+)